MGILFLESADILQKFFLKWTLLPAKSYSLYRVAYFRFFTFYSLFAPANACLVKNARGLVSPGRSAEKTVYLAPGLYALDCWVKTEDGIIHLTAGMTRPLTITEESANSPEPSFDNSITLHENEIDVIWNAETGFHSFAVWMEADSEGNPAHNNIHLIKLEENTDLDEVNIWMDWYRVGGLRAPAPADFLGGVSTYDAVPGESATYFSLEIDEPGEYAWIVQVPEGEQLWKTFSVQ